MNAYKNITSREIEDKLNDGHMRINRIISLAILGGSFFFLVVVFSLSNKNAAVETTTEMNGNPDIFLFVFLAMAFMGYSMFMVIPKLFLRKENLLKRLSNENADGEVSDDNGALKLIGIDRTLLIIRLAQLEGITLLGLVFLFIGRGGQSIFENPVKLIFLLPFFVMLIFVLNNCMTVEKTVMRIENNILNTLRNVEHQ